ncbi:MAG: hypothetical protein V4631_13920 [Pseudomonadota bacterium]
MKFFLDNNLSPLLANGLREFSVIDKRIDTVIHLSDRFPRNAKDEEWMRELGRDGEWIVISQDSLRKNDLEREALRRSGLMVFVLDKQWSHQKFWVQAHNLVKWWPSIIEQASRIEGGAACRVLWRHTGGGRFLQIPI